MFATTGTSTKELIGRGGWKSVAMVVRYEHASEERDALLTQAINVHRVVAMRCRLRRNPTESRAMRVLRGSSGG